MALTDIPDLTRELGGTIDPQLIDMRVTAICAEFDSRDIHHGTREGALTILLAAALNREWFEQINFAIYGSQLKFLEMLNESPPIPEETGRATYQAAAEAYPEEFAAIPFEQWLSFLTGTGFIALNEEGRYRIELQGRAFLKYLVARGYPRNRAF